MELEIINEMMAVLGFAIPSAVLWQVWSIKQSYDKTRCDVENLLKDIATIKRKMEDKELLENKNV